MRKTSIFAISSVGLLLLAACVGGLPAGSSDAGSIAGEAPSATPTVTPQVDEVSSGETDLVEDSGDQPSPPEPSATPTARPGLEATDPETVNLTSGKPTLLEFFAFW